MYFSESIGSTQNSLSSKIKDSIRKTSGILAFGKLDECSSKRTNTNLEHWNIFEKSERFYPGTRAQRQYHPGISDRRDLIAKRVHCSTWFPNPFAKISCIDCRIRILILGLRQSCSNWKILCFKIVFHFCKKDVACSITKLFFKE